VQLGSGRNVKTQLSLCPIYYADDDTALKRMVTIPRKLNMDQLKFHLISELGKKMERNGINKSDGGKRS